MRESSSGDGVGRGNRAIRFSIASSFLSSFMADLQRFAEFLERSPITRRDCRKRLLQEHGNFMKSQRRVNVQFNDFACEGVERFQGRGKRSQRVIAVREKLTARSIDVRGNWLLSSPTADLHQVEGRVADGPKGVELRLVRRFSQ